jgi:hypothetical protein
MYLILSGSASTWKMMEELFTKEALLNANYLGSVPYSEIKTYITQATVCVSFFCRSTSVMD